MDNKSTRMVINMSDFDVTKELQRFIKVKVVNDIVNDFNPLRLGTIFVNKVGNKYNIIDGQHRVAALSRLGFKDVQCDVYFDLTKKQEAEIFDGLANRTGHSQLEKHKSAILQEFPITMEIESLLLKLGMKFANTPTGNNLSCIAIVYAAYKKDKVLLEQALKLYIESYGLNEKNGLTGVELSGLLIFLNEANKDPKFSQEFLKQRLEITPKSKLLRMGSAQKEANDTTSPKGYALALLNLYNHYKNEKNRLGLNILS